MSFYFIRGWESDNQMQRGRALPARAGPSRTSIFAKGENANDSHHPPHKNRFYVNSWGRAKIIPAHISAGIILYIIKFCVPNNREGDSNDQENKSSYKNIAVVMLLGLA